MKHLEREWKCLVHIDKNAELCECIQTVEKWFWYDTITLLDCVLTDDTNNPEYSANTVYRRLEEHIKFLRLYQGEQIDSIATVLLQDGYTAQDIELLNQKRCRENQRHIE